MMNTDVSRLVACLALSLSTFGCSFESSNPELVDGPEVEDGSESPSPETVEGGGGANIKGDDPGQSALPPAQGESPEAPEPEQEMHEVEPPADEMGLGGVDPEEADPEQAEPETTEPETTEPETTEPETTEPETTEPETTEEEVEPPLEELEEAFCESTVCYDAIGRMGTMECAPDPEWSSCGLSDHDICGCSLGGAPAVLFDPPPGHGALEKITLSAAGLRDVSIVVDGVCLGRPEAACEAEGHCFGWSVFTWEDVIPESGEGTTHTVEIGAGDRDGDCRSGFSVIRLQGEW